ncbi:MAG: NADH-quinone oxidoreductase subunit C [Coxiella sp. RIFCSPHIGHO2_12_FULL_42_15]|nr:MAG: NADH-quinone oxidoreductase subunit C [Coxiella sp. RIFCSPHIGHO2_12_FULL_42_15]
MSQALLEKVQARFGKRIEHLFLPVDQMVTVELSAKELFSVAEALQNEPEFDFKLLVDLCGVDYLEYGDTEWRTEETTFSGFSRGRTEKQREKMRHWDRPRFAVVYHLLSLRLNQRLRLKVFLSENHLEIPSVNVLWNSANWFEREAFDFYGIVFVGHPDLRRLLTDYGFVGHPFRKDFPLIGEVELRYDALQERCIYEKVSIQPRTTVPKVVRSDHRYEEGEVPAMPTKKE